MTDGTLGKVVFFAQRAHTVFMASNTPTPKPKGRPRENRVRLSVSPNEMRILIGVLDLWLDEPLVRVDDEMTAEPKVLLHKLMAKAIENGVRVDGPWIQS